MILRNVIFQKKGAKAGKEKPLTDDTTAEILGTPKITTVYTKTDTSSQFNLPSSFVAFSGAGHKLGTSTSTQSSGKVVPSSGSSGNSKRKILKSPADSKPSSGDISSFFTKTIINISPDSELGSSQDRKTIMSPTLGKIPASNTNSRKTTKSSSPKKTSIGHKDISSYFNRTDLDISSDTDLLILSPPNKRRRSTPPAEESNSQTNSQTNAQTNVQTGKLACPICNKTGFADLNIHANLCLNSQLLVSSQNDSNYTKSPSSSQNTVVISLDDSIEETPLSDVQDIVSVENSKDSMPSSSLPLSSSASSTKPVARKSRDCPICGKSITSDLNKHLKICIASIPDDFDDDLLIIEDKTKEKSSQNIPTKLDTQTSVESVSASDKVKCPICGAMVNQVSINSHLDDCLSFNEFS